MSCKSEDADERLNRLARVRENQRKSRARRQQYIEELEQKVAVCNAQAQQREIEHLIALQKLEAENAKLRSLLQRVGLAPNVVEDFLKDASQPTVSEKIAIPRLKVTTSLQPSSSQYHTPTIKSDEPYTPTSVTSITATCTTNVPCAPTNNYDVTRKKPDGCCGPASATDITASCSSSNSCAPASQYAATMQRTNEPCIPPSSESASCNNNVSSESLNNSTTPKPLEPPVLIPVDPVATQQQNIKLPPIASLCDCGPESISKWPRINSPTNTTLCEVAQDLIDQYNTHGVDLNVIKQRLWAGFRNGDTNGCRVQNNVLFEVLDEISGDAPMSGGT
ncbi:conserved hypothetical protein [Talaromyces stipitatus ATCC 10500]|uniref:BZIP domain-containing protein n=1 Tax=Talaromyces stipitatus (strain ATCC 10500 / CBS 375.48 / QM 6759 / NRRL 1006) TaxID=441959 RepID=B8M5S0_TALSN|nr:uncharacterized protein TSTA_032980 [Talaromyces stipitatus ATCC 10500]EED20047.1 conserved hypothetical protein [Talaromyces stipitatus ATCC 10500]